jgi:hypothetical protein
MEMKWKSKIVIFNEVAICYFSFKYFELFNS